ncbi:hypothetical protein ncot_05515 [Nocardioides sp. JQ2195]|uniref:hypothetical protein n=1 Tax=Nocardioides sp. JQ2195 TaxID=2592334 RepID=UPI00143E1EAA|nr:hypothetical protein [Nocardioides sp. JQ2195]QIX26118.1 hypothetical protein ncot_05515 [Nocardioides sp. JQ2195]
MKEIIAPRQALLGALAAFVVLVLVATVAGLDVEPTRESGAVAGSPAVLSSGDDVEGSGVEGSGVERSGVEGSGVEEAPVLARRAPVAELPHGGTEVFDGRILVAYYGTGGTGALGVLGETTPDRAVRRLRRAAKPFGRPGRPAVPVFELIVTVADGTPGKDRDFSHDIAREQVRRYIRAAHRHEVMLVLDLQTGRSDFLDVAKRWTWALRHPHVGLALDPEWRMGRHGVPGQRIGSVSAAEVNRTSRWLSRLVRREHLPQKIFMLHQFRREMIPNLAKVNRRRNLALVQHVDGFGTPGQKLDTYRHVAAPRKFHMGFKLFYDEDVRRMSPAKVKRIRPEVEFVSFQ